MILNWQRAQIRHANEDREDPLNSKPNEYRKQQQQQQFLNFGGLSDDVKVSENCVMCYYAQLVAFIR